MDDEQQRYEAVKARAKADPAIVRLKARSDSAATVTEAREASIAYNHALFQKMRELDSSVGERAELVEQAILRRINQ